MDKQEAIAKLNALTGGDNEADHGEADEILLECVDPEIADAWCKAYRRIGFWYA